MHFFFVAGQSKKGKRPLKKAFGKIVQGTT